MSNNSQRVVIVGAGFQGRIVAEILELRGVRAIGFADDTPSLLGTTLLGVPVLGPLDDLGRFEHDAIIVAVGDNRYRRLLTERFTAAGETLATAIHPFSFVSPHAFIGEGTMISAGALVLPGARIGRGVLLNTKSSVDHDSVIADYAHVGAGATVGAKVSLGEETFVAMGATVISDLAVGARSIVGAGAVVIRNVPDDVTVIGVPARVRS